MDNDGATQNLLRGQQESVFIATISVVGVGGRIECAGQHRVGHFGCIQINAVKINGFETILHIVPIRIASVGLGGQLIATFSAYALHFNFLNAHGREIAANGKFDGG